MNLNTKNIIVGSRNSQLAKQHIKIFERSFKTYSNESKISILKINNSIIEKFGAVSKQTAYNMSSSLTNNFNSPP